MSTGGAAVLLLWVTIKPVVLAVAAVAASAQREARLGESASARRLGQIGVALEHDQADAEILNRALGLAQSQVEPASWSCCTSSIRR